MNEFFINVKVDREERPDVDKGTIHKLRRQERGEGGLPNAYVTT